MALQFHKGAGPYQGRFIHYKGFDYNREGIARCAVGPEIRRAVQAVTDMALAYAKMASPGDDAGRYDQGFRSDVRVIPDFPYRRIDAPDRRMPRWGGYVQNVSSLAILVEVGSDTYPAQRVLGQTLEWLELVADG